MTFGQYVAMFLGTLVIALGVSWVPAHADWDGQPGGSAQDTPKIQDTPNIIDWTEMAPGLTGFHEVDDMPSYLSPDRAVPDDAPAVADAKPPQEASVLAADGPGGLRWSILARLALLSILFFAVVIYGRRSNA